MQFFVPISFTLANLPSTQEPKTASDTPAPVAPAGGPQAGTTQPTGTPGAGPAPQGPCSMETVLLMGGMLALMYFMLIKPEQKRKKEQQTLLASIKQGDHVVTAGGMHGVVARLTEKTVTLRVDSQQITFDRVAVARVVRDEADKPAKSS